LGVATVSRSTTTASPLAGGGGTQATGLLAYASCMRSHGVPNFLTPSVAEGSLSKASSTRRARSALPGQRGPEHLRTPAPRRKLAERAAQPGPLHAFGERIRAHKGSQVAAIAVARKLACLAWQLLTKEEDYAFAQPSRVRAKVRRVELDAGAPPIQTHHGGQRISASPAERDAERALVGQADAAYRRLIADWKATGPAKTGAGATHGHASTKPSKRPATRQAQAQTPAL
jgi:transposase